MAKYPRLQKRKENGIYYFRVSIPKDLVQQIGKNELKVSLKTSNIKLAKHLVVAQSSIINQHFEELRGNGVTHIPEMQRVIGIVSKQYVSLGSLIERYKNAPEKSNLSNKTRKDYDSIYRLISELLGKDADIKSINREKCRWFQQTVTTLPINCVRRFPNIPAQRIVEITKEKQLKTISARTVNKHITHLSILLEWASREGLIYSNPAKGLLVDETKPEQDKRKPFTQSELRAIFGNQEMIEYKAANSAKYWLPAIALWTGARINEICQLTPKDIQVFDGVTCIVIRDGDGKHLKTNAANRIIPVHKKLMENGFLELLEHARASNNQHLLSDMPMGERNNPSDLLSKWFGRYLSKIMVKTATNCFHSFRHNFRDAMREAGINREIVQAIGGWRDKNAGTEDVYGNGFTVHKLNQELQKITYDGL